MPAETHEITFDSDGRVRMIYSDSLVGLLAEGTAIRRRVSHVEPDDVSGGWTADLGPIQGPVLGPFPLRAEALAAEVAWLKKHLH